MVTKENTNKNMKLQTAEVAGPLASVKSICEAGRTVMFDDEGRLIYNKGTGGVNYIREEGVDCMFDVWVPPSSGASFQR